MIPQNKRANAAVNVEKEEFLYTIHGIINWYRHLGKQYGAFLKFKNKVK